MKIFKLLLFGHTQIYKVTKNGCLKCIGPKYSNVTAKNMYNYKIEKAVCLRRIDANI